MTNAVLWKPSEQAVPLASEYKANRDYVIIERPRLYVDLSASKIKRFRQCQEKYRRIYRGREQEFAGEDADVGKLVHKVIECEALTRIKENRTNLSPDPAEMIETLNYIIHKLDGEAVSPEAIKRAVEILETYSPKLDLTGVVAVEEPFSLDIGNGKTFGGIFDLRKSTPSGGVRLIDWKTGHEALSDDEIRHDTQATAYLWAARRLFPEASTISFTAVYITRDIVSSLDWSNDLDRAAGIHLRDMSDRISAELAKEQNFYAGVAKYSGIEYSDNSIWPAKVGPGCAGCNFRASCIPYEEWVKAHGRIPLLPLGNMSTEELASEAVKSRTLEAVHGSRRKDAYARIWERMGKEKRLKAGGYEFYVKSRPEKKIPQRADVIRVLRLAGVDEETAMSVIEHKLDWAKVKKVINDLPKDVRKDVREEIDDMIEIVNTNPHLEAREVDGNPF